MRTTVLKLTARPVPQAGRGKSILRRLRSRRSLLIGLALVVAAIGYYFLRPLSRDEVAFYALRALERGDVNTLLRLTMAEERDKLGLTEDSVRGFLRRTLWAKGVPGRLKMERIDQYPVDQVLYRVTPAAGFRDGFRFPLYLMVTETPRHGWTFALGQMLYSTSFILEERSNARPEDFMRCVRRYRQLAVQYGIKGLRNNTEGYVLHDASGRRITPLGRDGSTEE